MDQVKNVDTMEFDVPVRYIVTPELGAGYGKISAPNRYEDSETQAEAEQIRAHLEPVEQGAACGCIDGRCVMCLLNGAESKLGPKTAGGIAETTLVAMELEDAFGDGKSMLEHMGRVVDILEDRQMPVRFHIDADHRDYVDAVIGTFREELAEVANVDDFIAAVEAKDVEDKGTGCGMGDQMVGAVSNMARLPRKYVDAQGVAHTETEQEVEARLTFIRETTRAIKGDQFDEAAFEAHVARATELVQSGALDSWHSLKALVIADRVLRDRGVEDGIYSRTEVLESPHDQGVHGHVEDWVVINKVHGTTINQTKYARITGRQVFTVDEWLADDIGNASAQTMSGEHTALQAGIAQAVTETNLAGYVQLTDGTQRALILTK